MIDWGQPETYNDEGKLIPRCNNCNEPSVIEVKTEKAVEMRCISCGQKWIKIETY